MPCSNRETGKNKNMEQKLRESEARFESILVSAMDAIITIDEGHRIVLFNPAAERMFGYAAAEAIGQSIDLLLPQESRANHGEHISRFGAGAIANRQMRSSTIVVGMRAGGEIFPIEAAISQVKTATQTLYTAIVRDITERKRTQDALQQAVDDVELFIYSAAHDLRTPLRGINGFSAILASDYADRLDATALGYLKRIQAAASRMWVVMDELQALAHAGSADLRRQAVDLSAMVQALAAAYKAADPQRQVELAIAPGVVANADPAWLHIALDNLFGNAWKFTATREVAKIEFGLTMAEGRPAYFVRDNGVGFDPAFSGKLFQQFQRLHTDKEYEGSGVGLAIVARVIRRHGGCTWAEGAVGHGATFYFTLG
jgi:PAS domain S-box-containing protein